MPFWIASEPCCIFFHFRAHINYSVVGILLVGGHGVYFSCIFTLFQTRQIRIQCGQSRRASSQCVLMLQSHRCQMRCTITRWLLKCSMAEAVAGTVETAGLTKRCRLLSCIYICPRSSKSRYESRCIEIFFFTCNLFCFPQFIIGEDGSCGLTYEHAAVEGPPIVFLVDHVVDYM